MVSLSLHVVGHVARERQAVELAASLGATLHMDNGELGAYGNHRRALLAARTNASHALILEDDVIPCGDLIDAATWYADQRPDHMLVGFASAGYPFPDLVAQAAAQADDAQSDWLPLRLPYPCWLQCFVMPTADIPAVIESADRLQHRQAAQRIGMWHWERGRVSYPWPSWVEHRDESSLVYGARRKPGRVAVRVRGGAVPDSR